MRKRKLSNRVGYYQSGDIFFQLFGGGEESRGLAGVFSMAEGVLYDFTGASSRLGFTGSDHERPPGNRKFPKSITDAPRSKTCDELPQSQMRYTNLALIPAVNTLSVQTMRFIFRRAGPLNDQTR